MEIRAQHQLYRHGPSGTVLTATGEFWAAQATFVLQRLSESVIELGDSLSAPTHIGASRVLADHLLPHWLSSLPDSNSFNVYVGNSTEILQQVQRGISELAFVELRHAAHPDLKTVALAKDCLVVIVSPNHPWASYSHGITANTLLQNQLIGREATSGTNMIFKDVLTERRLPMPNLTVEVGSNTALKETVADSLFASVVPRLAIKTEVAQGRLVEIPVTDLDMTVWVCAVYPKHNDLSERSRRLLHHIQHLTPPIEPFT